MDKPLTGNQIDEAVTEALADLRGKGVDITGVVLVAFGPDKQGALCSKVGGIVNDQAQLPFAYAYGAILLTASALPPSVMPGMDHEEKQV